MFSCVWCVNLWLCKGEFVTAFGVPLWLPVPVKGYLQACHEVWIRNTKVRLLLSQYPFSFITIPLVSWHSSVANNPVQTKRKTLAT